MEQLAPLGIDPGGAGSGPRTTAEVAALRAALREAKASAARNALLAEATSSLATSLDVSGSLQRLAELIVPSLADWVVIDLADDHQRPVQIAMLHRDGHFDLVERFRAIQPTTLTPAAPIMRILAGEAPILVQQPIPERSRTFVTDSELLDLCDALGLVCAMYVPLVARDRVLGCVALASNRPDRLYGPADLDFAADLARRAALVVDNTGLYERERRIAQTLQESLLPQLPVVAGVDLAARYLPSDRTAAVGGDFYDVLALPSGSVGVAIGDVAGHDITAAAAMGQLRGLLRACAWELDADGVADPAAVLHKLSRLVEALDLVDLATVTYLIAARHAETGWRLQWASAGHLPLLLRRPDGRVVRLQSTAGVPLGIPLDLPLDLPGGPDTCGGGAGRWSVEELTVEGGSLLVACTDGLVERRDEDLEVGLGRLERRLADLPATLSVDEVAEELSARTGLARFDDVAVLVARLG